MSRGRSDIVRFEPLGFDLYQRTDGPHVPGASAQRHRDPAGVLCVRWAAIPLQSVPFKEVCRHYPLKIPSALWFMSWDPPRGIVEPLLGGRMLLYRDTVPVCQDEGMFRRWSAIFGLCPGGGSVGSILPRDVLAAATPTGVKPENGDSAAPRWLDALASNEYRLAVASLNECRPRAGIRWASNDRVRLGRINRRVRVKAPVLNGCRVGSEVGEGNLEPRGPSSVLCQIGVHAG